jgi:hypothetical protein
MKTHSVHFRWRWSRVVTTRVERAMNPVFQIERETVASCEMPSGTDAALLLIAKSYEGI